MQKFEKWVIFDYKYALTDDLDWKIPTKTWNTIKKLKEKGFGIGVMSSSPYRKMEYDFKDKFKAFDMVASHNGARVDYDGKTYETKIPLSEIDQIFNSSEYITGFSIGEKMYLDSEEDLEWLAERYRFKNYQAADHADEDILAARLIFKNQEDRDEKFPALFKRLNRSNFNIEKAGAEWVLVTIKEASRLNVLKKFFQDAEIYYIGGSPSDHEVFESRMFNMKKITLESAPKEIKNLAQIILPTTNNAGITFDIEE